MPGLSFLAKKKWHTSNIKNVEKVWVAEQKDEQERKRLAEFQKQLLEERQIQELRQLQAAQGQVVKHTDNSLDWMYEGPGGGSQVQKDSEEYLLGKIYKPQQTKTFEVGAAPIAAQDSSGSNSWVSKVANKNDIFSRKHEDPMIAIKQAEKAQRDKVVNNPLQMERIRQSVAKHLEETEYQKDREARARMELRERMEREMKRENLEDDYSDDDRSHRKERKHKKKHHKKDKKKSKKERRHHSDSDNSSDSSDDDRRESSRRSKRSRSRDLHEGGDVDEKRPRHSNAPPEPQRVIDRPVLEPAVVGKIEETTRTIDEYHRGQQQRVRGDEDNRGQRERDIDDRQRRSPHRQYHETNRNDRGSRRDSRDRDRDRDHSDRHRRADSRDKESRIRREHSRDRNDRYRRDRSPDRRRDSRDGDRKQARSNSRSRDHLASSDNKRSDSSRADHRQDEFGRSRHNDDDHRQKSSTTEKRIAHEDSNTTSLAERKSWGLVKGGSSANAGDGLGPSAELLKRKEEEKRKEEQQRQENLQRARGGGSGRNAISEEERLARLRAMQQDAEVIDVTRVVRNKAEAADHNAAHDSAQVHAGKSAEFIHDMRSEVLRSAGDSMSMKDRLDTHRHYVQKGAALDDANTSNFLRR